MGIELVKGYPSALRQAYRPHVTSAQQPVAEARRGSEVEQQIIQQDANPMRKLEYSIALERQASSGSISMVHKEGEWMYNLDALEEEHQTRLADKERKREQQKLKESRHNHTSRSGSSLSTP